MMTTTLRPVTRRLIHQGLLSLLALSMAVQSAAAQSVFDSVFGSNDPFANNNVGFGDGALVGDNGTSAGGPDGAYVGENYLTGGGEGGAYIDDSTTSAGGKGGASVSDFPQDSLGGGGAYVGPEGTSAGGEGGASVSPELVSAGGGDSGAAVQGFAAPPAEPAINTNNINTGIVDSSVVGNSNQTFDTVGNAVGGDANDANISNQQTNVHTGDNTNTASNANSVQSVNQNQVAPQFIVPGGTASGGNSVLMLPQNPLQMLPDRLARKLFQVQFGARNNPNIGGGSNSMSWFMQSGLSIPFGKIPEPLRARNDSQMDLVRERLMDRDRQAFASLSPNSKADVQGKVVGLNAYNFAAMKTAKIDPNTPTAMMATVAPLNSPVNLTQPRVLALAEAKVFTRPLNTGNEIGKVEMGEEYPYLGHTKSGWVKVLLPNGEKGWTLDQFEYIKSDYTQVDELAEKITLPTRQTAVNTPARKNNNSPSSSTLIR